LKDFEKDSLQQGLSHFQLIDPTSSSDHCYSINQQQINDAMSFALEI